MFVDIGRSKQGNKYYPRYLLRESFREDGKVKHRTIANLSHCSMEEINAIKLALRHKGSLSQLIDINQIGTKQGRRIGAVFTLNALAREIGLPKALGYHQEGKLALWQVLARCINQGSRLSAVRLAESHATSDILRMDSFNEDDLYANLSWLAEHQEAIEKRLFRQSYGDAIPELFLYDVTSSYLEGTRNALGAFGYNRDGKAGKMQIVIGLLTGPDGMPVAVRVFEGNTPDSKTVAEQVRTLADSFGVQEVTVVGDRGMIKQTGIDLLHDKSFHYITAITKPQIRKLLRDGVFQLGLFEDNICEVECDGVRYILRRNPARAKEISQTRESKLIRIRELTEKKNLYLREHPKARIEVTQGKIEEKIAQLNTTGWIRVIRHENVFELVIDEDAGNQEAELDGCYVIKTDLPVNAAAARTVHDRYKDLSQVERAFRTFKNSHLEIRPIFVRNEATTRGHVFVVMLAYLLERRLAKSWHHLEITVPEAIDELGSLRAVEISIGNVTCQKVPEPSGLSKQLLDSAGIKLPRVLPLRNVHVATRKKLVSQRNLN